jgi:hypothetical protein
MRTKLSLTVWDVEEHPIPRLRLLERIARSADEMLTTRAEDERQAAETALEDALIALHEWDEANG